MALIECPECKKMISDQAKVCPECGYPIKGKTTNVKISKLSKNKVTAVVIAIAVVIALIITVPKIRNYQEKNDEYQQAVKLYKQGEYIKSAAKFKDLKDFKDSKEQFKKAEKKGDNASRGRVLMATGAIYLFGQIAYYRCSQLSDGWSKAIDKGDDFNSKIQDIMQKWIDNGELDELNDTKKGASECMSSLNELTPKWMDAQDSVEDLYTAANKLYQQVIEPTGSLITFNSSTKEYKSDLESSLEAIRVSFPNIGDDLYEIIDR